MSRRRIVAMSFREWLIKHNACSEGRKRVEAAGGTLPEFWLKADWPSDLSWLAYRMPLDKWIQKAIHEITTKCPLINDHPACQRCCDEIRERVPVYFLPPFVGKFLSDRQQSAIRRMLRDGEL